MYELVLAASGACLLAVAAQTSPAPRAADCPFPAQLETFAIALERTPTIVADDLRQWIDWQGGSSYVQIGRHERAGPTSEWVFEEILFSTDLKITDVAFARGGQTLYVAGIRSTPSGCEDVIERWDVEFPPGARAIDVAPAPPRGTPAPLPFTGTVSATVVGGGPFIAAAERRATPTTKRTVLYSGSGLGPFAAIAADPEQRFVLAVPLSGAGLYSFDPSACGSPPTLEFDATALPRLGAVRRIGVREHEELGRFDRLIESRGDFIEPDSGDTFIVDGDNDGRFDSAITVAPGDVVAARPFDDDAKLRSLIDITDRKVP